MKKQWIVLAMALVMLLTGCQAETAIPADSLRDTEIEQTSSFSGGKTETTESESKSSDMAVTAGESEASSAETASLAETSEPSVQTESNHTVTTPEKKEETQTEPSEAPQKEPVPEATKPAETVSESKPEEVVTSEPTTKPEPTMPPAPEPKSIYDYEFDVEAIRQELIAVGTGMGLSVDSSLTPSNASWANPVTASQSFQGSGLERSLKDYVRSMPSIITAYGGDPIQYFTVYAENLGGGSYCFYFLY